MKFLKKVFKFIRWVFAGTVWSCVYLFGTLYLFKSVWGFNYLSRNSWSVISDFWSAGGRINTGKDYIFIICLLLLIPLWLWGWRKVCKLNFLNLIFAPFIWYQNKKADTYMEGMSRIKIHNIGISVGDDIKQNFENKLKQQQESAKNELKTSSSIRKNLKTKLTNK